MSSPADYVDVLRAVRVAEINSSPVPEGALTTDQMREQYDVLGFAAPYVVVTRKSDGVKGTLEFKHQPRWYFNFKPS